MADPVRVIQFPAIPDDLDPPLADFLYQLIKILEMFLQSGSNDGGVTDHDNLNNVTSDQHHDRAHTLTSASDHSGGNDKVIYTGNAGAVTELALGADGTYLHSNGTTSAPTWKNPLLDLNFEGETVSLVSNVLNITKTFVKVRAEVGAGATQDIETISGRAVDGNLLILVTDTWNDTEGYDLDITDNGNIEPQVASLNLSSSAQQYGLMFIYDSDDSKWVRCSF
jgi:hypothetical protein